MRSSNRLGCAHDDSFEHCETSTNPARGHRWVPGRALRVAPSAMALTEQERLDRVRAGREAYWATLTPEQREERNRRAAETRRRNREFEAQRQREREAVAAA